MEKISPDCASFIMPSIILSETFLTEILSGNSFTLTNNLGIATAEKLTTHSIENGFLLISIMSK